MRKAVNCVCLRGKELLLVKKHTTWILPGGKPNTPQEPDNECLLRELKEELPNTTFKMSHLFGVFRGKTPHKKDMLEAHVYMGTITGDITPSAEINDARFMRIADMDRVIISVITLDVIKALIIQNHL